MFSKRTDLALEARELLRESGRSEPDGISQETELFGSITVDRITILSEEGERALGKPRGRYITITMPENWVQTPDALMEVARVVGGELRALLPGQGGVLAVGLGNRFITPDAIGPAFVDSVIVTRHLREHMPEAFGHMREVSALSTGVLGLTGIETAEIVRGVCQRVGPKAVVAVDALASRSVNRLCRTVQLADTGITPGGGAYNARSALTQDSLGIPVVALGVPTVVDARTLAADIVEQAGIPAPDPEKLVGQPNLLVTPKDIDLLVDKSAKALGYAVNLALQGDMSCADMEQFLS